MESYREEEKKLYQEYLNRLVSFIQKRANDVPSILGYVNYMQSRGFFSLYVDSYTDIADHDIFDGYEGILPFLDVRSGVNRNYLESDVLTSCGIENCVYDGTEEYAGHRTERTGLFLKYEGDYCYYGKGELNPVHYSSEDRNFYVDEIPFAVSLYRAVLKEQTLGISFIQDYTNCKNESIPLKTDFSEEEKEEINQFFKENANLQREISWGYFDRREKKMEDRK